MDKKLFHKTNVFENFQSKTSRISDTFYFFYEMFRKHLNLRVKVHSLPLPLTMTDLNKNNYNIFDLNRTLLFR